MEQKVFQGLGIAAKASEDILTLFGHANWASAVDKYESLAPVAASLVDLFTGLFHHNTASAPVNATAK